jgi:hypothetical protein
MDNLRVVLIPVTDDFDGRELAEEMENQKQTLYWLEEVNKFLVFTLSEFMDLCNDQELNLEDWWISYVQVDEKTDYLAIMDRVSEIIIQNAKKRGL